MPSPRALAPASMMSSRLTTTASNSSQRAPTASSVFNPRPPTPSANRTVTVNPSASLTPIFIRKNMLFSLNWQRGHRLRARLRETADVIGRQHAAYIEQDHEPAAHLAHAADEIGTDRSAEGRCRFDFRRR